MDLWDVIKLMFRLWYASVPLLLASLASAIWIGVTTQPDYVATSYLTLLPPTTRADAATNRNINPWTVDSLMGAVVTRLNSKTQHDQLEAEGLSPIWEANTDVQFREQLALEVTADSAEQARATTQRLHAIAIDEVAGLQERYRLRPGEEITAVQFDQGENVVPVKKKIYRLMIAVAGAGIILTAGLVIALDALLRWRSNRKVAAAAAAAPRKERQGVARVGPIPVAALANSPEAVRPDASGPPEGPETDHSDAGARVGSNNGASAETTVLPVHRTGDAAPAVAMEFRVNSVESGAPPAPRAAAVDEPRPNPTDATIVLPLSNSSWAGREEQQQRRDR